MPFVAKDNEMHATTFQVVSGKGTNPVYTTWAEIDDVIGILEEACGCPSEWEKCWSEREQVTKEVILHIHHDKLATIPDHRNRYSSFSMLSTETTNSSVVSRVPWA